MSTVSVFSLSAGTAIAAGDVLPYVDISNPIQNPSGSLLKITVTNFFAAIPVPVGVANSVTVTSASATALTVGRLGATTPAFTVDASTASQVAGVKVTGAATGGTVAVVATDSGANASLVINAKGSGTIGIGSVSTGAVTITPALTQIGLATFNGGAAVASGQTLTLTGATVAGQPTWSNGQTFPAVTVGSGVSGAALNIGSALSAIRWGSTTAQVGEITYSGSDAVIRSATGGQLVLQTNGSSTALTITTAQGVQLAGTLLVASNITQTAGTAALQAVTGTTAAFSSTGQFANTLTVTGSGTVVLGTGANGGMVQFKSGDVARWQWYTLNADPNIYLRDLVNARMQVIYSPGASVTVASTEFGSSIGIGATPTYAVDIAVGAFKAAVGFRAASNTNGDIWYYATGTVTGTANVFDATVDATGLVQHKIFNSRNAAGSQVKQSIYSAGASADDAWLEIGVSGVTSWIIGVDNSDSDKLKIGPNANPSAGTASIAIATDHGVALAGNLGIGTAVSANTRISAIYTASAISGVVAGFRMDLIPSATANNDTFRILYAAPTAASVGVFTGTTYVGLEIGDVVGAATNYAIRTGLGTVSFGGALTIVGALSGVTTLTATTLAGTLSTAAQPNVTSVGTLSSLSVGAITSTGLIQTTLTTQQLRLRYDASNHLGVTVASTGAVTIGVTAATTNAITLATSNLLVSGSSPFLDINDTTGTAPTLRFLSGTQQFRIVSNADNQLRFLNAAGTQVGLIENTVWIFNNMASTNASANNMCITDGTAPSGNPTGGGFLYSEAGAGKWRGSGGTVTAFGPT